MQDTITDAYDTEGGSGDTDSGSVSRRSRGTSAGSGGGSGDSGSAGGSDFGDALGDGGTGDSGRGDSGTGTGTGKRRGRPRKQPVELVGEPVRPTLTDTKPRGGGRKRGPDLSVLVDTTIVGLFGLVAVATGHEHWLKERDDVLPMTGPLNAWIDQLPAKALKRIEKNLAPALFAVGCAIVVGPDIAAEVRLRAEHKKLIATLPRSQGARQPGAYTSPASPVGAANGAGEGRGGAGGWTSSIPTTPPIGFDGEV